MSTEAPEKPAAKAAKAEPTAAQVARAARAAAAAIGGGAPGLVLRMASYDPRHPDAPAPQRTRKDPRIQDQGLTAFTVEVSGVPVGRVRMVEFAEKRGWFYQAETLPAGRGAPKPIGEPLPKRTAAVAAVLQAASA